MLEKLIASGGDHRVLIEDDQGQNLYGCRSKPQDDISYSSSTASTVSETAFQAAEKAFNRLKPIQESNNYIEEFQSIRNRLRTYLGLPDNVDIALGPSGTDLEMIALIAGLRDQLPITNILVAKDEVGSGVGFAAAGQHSTNVAPTGDEVKKGQTLEGFESIDLKVRELPVREDSGKKISDHEFEKNLKIIIKEELDAGRRVLLHVVHPTKSGIIAPSPQVFENIYKEFKKHPVDFLVDACQHRISNQTINKFLSMGCMVLTTGSKFFGGAPFSSALLIPAQIRDFFTTMASKPLKGLSHYFYRTEMPKRWNYFNESLKEGSNVGLLLRWETALAEMQEFSSIQEGRIRQTVNTFTASISELLENNPLIGLLPLEEEAGLSADSLDEVMLKTLRTIFFKEQSDQEITLEDAKTIYQGLFRDLSELGSTDEEKELLRSICHLGQPVKMIEGTSGQWIGTLRISLSARKFSDLSGKVAAEQEEVFTRELSQIIDKTSFIVKNFDSVKLALSN